VRVLPVLLCVAACTGGTTDDSDPGIVAGQTTRAQLFNATADVPVFDALVPDGPVVAAGLDQGTGSEVVDLPVAGPLSLRGDGFDLTTDALSLDPDTRYSWLLAGDGGDHPWRSVALADDFPEPIPGVAHIRFIIAHPDVADGARVFVDGAVLAGGLGYDVEWPTTFMAVAAGPGHPIRLDAQDDAFDAIFGDEDFEDDGLYTAVIHARAGGGEGVRMKLTRHPRE